MSKKYLPSGDGYWHDSEDPSKGCVGIPPEIEEEINKKWGEEFFLDVSLEKLRIGKAMRLINESRIRDIPFRINFLKRLGYREIQVKGKKASLEEAGEKYFKNLDRMYNRTINGLRDFVEDPKKESKLISRLDSFQ